MSIIQLVSGLVARPSGWNTMVYWSLRLGARDVISSYSHANNALTQILR